MGNPPEALMPDANARLQILLEDGIMTFTGQDTIVRRFREGDGKYDHCVHVLPDGRLIAFTPDAEAFAEFIRLGFFVREDDMPDPQTLEHYDRVQAAHSGNESI